MAEPFDGPEGAESFSEEGFRAGLVAIAGKPNVGKSTLMNALVGVKLSAVSRRPQTTRNEIKGILSRSDFQIVFLDTPGLIQPRDRFNEFLMEEAVRALRDVDLLYHLVEFGDPKPVDDATREALESIACPKFLVVNKVDRTPRRTDDFQDLYETLAKSYDALHRISALERYGLEDLLAATVDRLPLHPPYYDEEDLTDRDLRFLVAEIVREKLFEFTGQEVPYSVATQVDEFKERPGRKTYISVRIYVERESQKGVIVGAGGRLLKKVGERARPEIEELLGEPVFLELWVKLRKNWRKKETELRRFGYGGRSRTKKGGRKKRG